MKTRITVLFALLSITGQALAYELGTHAAITLQAFSKSDLNTTDRTLIKNLGLDNPPPIFGSDYWDMMGTALNRRKCSESSMEQRIFGILQATTQSIEGLLMCGAIREDDSPTEDNPQDDVFNPDLKRPLHHFFDPYYNRPLDVPGLSFFDSDVHKAPDWAVGSRDSFAAPNAPETDRRNHFTVLDAREAMYRAFTLWGKNPDGGYTDLDTSSTAGGQEKLRKEYWATTFRALGDVLHLIQDMAQPQHTRNEAHSGKGGEIIEEMFTGHASYYESYIEARALGDNSFKVGDDLTVVIENSVPLNFDGYPIPRFANYSDYWSTGPGSLSGQGLADYSNRGFFTPAHNLGNLVYGSPSNNPGDYYPVLADYGDLDAPFGTRIEYLEGAVMDTLVSGRSAVIRMTTRSLWDLPLSTHLTLGPTYSLNRFNYDDMAALLIPRAVAYSAGLINHFFRGRMEISLPDEGVYAIVDHSTVSGTDPGAGFKGFDKIKLKLRNATPGDEAMTGGRLMAVVKFRRNLCYKDDLEASYPPLANGETCRSSHEEIVVSNEQNDVTLTGTARPFEFTFPKALPINAIDVRLQAVYRGTLGAENDAVVVATKDIAEPTFFTYMNASDYIHINGKVYTRDEINQDPALLAQVYPEPCVDDRLSPPQLKPECFLPFPITMALSFGSTPTIIRVDDMPVQRFLLIAFLADKPDAAILSQSGPCVPRDPFPVPPVEWQETYDSAADETTLIYPTFTTLRGVSGWYNVACVTIGDGIPPGTDDDRYAKMLPIDNKIPYAVTITGF